MYDEGTIREMPPLKGRLAILSNDLELALARVEALVVEVGKVEEEVQLWEAAERHNGENLDGLVRYVLCRYPDDQESQEPSSPTGQGGGPGPGPFPAVRPSSIPSMATFTSPSPLMRTGRPSRSLALSGRQVVLPPG